MGHEKIHCTYLFKFKIILYCTHMYTYIVGLNFTYDWKILKWFFVKKNEFVYYEHMLII